MGRVGNLLCGRATYIYIQGPVPAGRGRVTIPPRSPASRKR
jgi:hypothetical protein